MTKAELTERIIDALIDPWTDNPEDYIDLDPIDLEEAEEVLKDIRDNESAADLEPDECLPEDVTPAQVQETWNCLIRARKHEARVSMLAEYFEEHPDFIVYSYSYLYEYHPQAAPKDMAPLDFFTDELEEGGFYFDTNDRTFTKEEILRIFANSLSSMDMNDDYICFHDYGNEQKMLTLNDPTEAIDVEEFAAIIVDNHDALTLFINEVIDDDDLVKEIFHCTKEEVLK